VAAGRTGVGKGDGDAAGVADCGAAVATGGGESVPRAGDVGAADAVEAGVVSMVTGTDPKESALTPLTSAKPAISRAAMTTRALFITHQTLGLHRFVHPIVLRIAEVNVSIDPVRLMVGSVEVPRDSGVEMQWRRSR